MTGTRLLRTAAGVALLLGGARTLPAQPAAPCLPLRTVDTPPTQEQYRPWAWQKPHRPNPTGTPAAQRPTGSTLAQGRRPKATGDYKAWVPGAKT